MVKGVIFDMDGTMFGTEQLSAICWKEAGKQLGIEVGDELIASIQGRNPTAIRRAFLEAFGEDFDYDGARAVKHQHFTRMTEDGIPIKKGLKELLEFLNMEGIPAVVATSTEERRASEIIKKAGVYDCFADFVYGDRIEQSKPKPDIFLEAARRIGQNPRDCLVLEDSAAGLLAGKAAGGYTIYIPDIARVPEEVKTGITAVMPDLSCVIDWIKERRIQIEK